MSELPLEWHTEKRKLSQLIPFDKNPRKISEEQKEQLKKSLTKFNLIEPPAIDIDGKILSGHQRISILKHLNGQHEIDVRVPNRKLTDDEISEINLRMNQNRGEWDFELLSNFNIDLLKDIGFNEMELQFQNDINFDDIKSTENRTRQFKDMLITCSYCKKSFNIKI